jgi:hypothetical protein
MLTDDKVAEVPATPATSQNKTTASEFNSYTTCQEAQVQQLAELLKRGPRNTHQLRAMGISHPAARALDLQRRGWSIVSKPISSFDWDGLPHSRVALYTLASAPPHSLASRLPADPTGDLFADLEEELE